MVTHSSPFSAIDFIELLIKSAINWNRILINSSVFKFQSDILLQNILCNDDGLALVKTMFEKLSTELKNCSGMLFSRN